MSYPMQARYETFQEWVRDAHSVLSQIQYEIDGVELSGGPSAYIEGDALNDLIEMADTFYWLLNDLDNNRAAKSA